MDHFLINFSILQHVVDNDYANHSEAFLDFVVAIEFFLLFFDWPGSAPSKIIKNVFDLAPGGVVAILHRFPLSQLVMPLLLFEPIYGVLGPLSQHEIGHADLLFECFVSKVLKHLSVAFPEIVLKIHSSRLLIIVGKRLYVKISSCISYERTLIVYGSADSPVSLETIILRLESTQQIS